MSSTIGLDYLESRHRTVVPHAHAVDYDDIIRLFTHRHTAGLYKRQAAAFRQIAREKSAGLTIADIDPVCRVVQLGLERRAGIAAEGVPPEVFVKPLCSLIRLFGLPYIKKKAYEEFDNGESLALVLDMLVSALDGDEPELIHAVSQTVMSFTANRDSREFALRCELVAVSGLVAGLVLAMQRNAHDLATALPLVTACRQLATIPALTAQFDENVFGVLITLLERDFREPLVLEVIQLLWLLLDHKSDDDDATPSLGASMTLRPKSPASIGSSQAIASFASLKSITVLSNLLRQSFVEGHRNVDRQIRNDILVLLILVAREAGPRKLLDETGIFGDILSQATHSEMKILADQTPIPINTLEKTATVGLNKIRALRTSNGVNADDTAANSLTAYSFTQDFITNTDDFQFKLLCWSLIGACACDTACHASLIRTGDVLQSALLYLDAAEAWNIRTGEQARLSETKRQAQNQALTGTLSGAATIPPVQLTLSQSHATLLIGRMSFSQLLHLQDESLKLLSKLVTPPAHSFERFKHFHGIQRVLKFSVEIIDNTHACEEKRLNATMMQELQGRAIGLLSRALQAGVELQAPCPVEVSMASVQAQAFGPNDTTSTLPVSAPNESSSVTALAMNAELQELLSTDGDEAFAAIQSAMATNTAHATPAMHASSSTASMRSGGVRSSTSSLASVGVRGRTVGMDLTSIDSAHVIGVLLTLFSDPSKPASLRGDAISCVALLVGRNPPLQRQLRQLKGIHVLVQFLCNDGARLACGLGVGGLDGGQLACRTSNQTNLITMSAKSPQLLLDVVDCIWHGVVGIRTNEELFLALNGIDLLLDLLLICPAPQRKQVLGLLADLLHVSGSERFLFEWRSGPGRVLPNGATSANAPPIADLAAGSRSHSSSVASLPSAQLFDLAAQTDGFSALDLLLSLWPEPTLRDQQQKQLYGTLSEGDEAGDVGSVAHKSSSSSLLPRVGSNLSLRPALYAIFARIGFRDDNPFLVNATPVQRGQLYSIAHFVDRLRSDSLAAVASRLTDEGIQLVEEDAQFLQQNFLQRDDAAEQANAFQEQQLQAQQEVDAEEIENYLHQITSRKDQNEAFLISSAKRARKQTMRRRLLYKEMRQQMLKNSTDQTRPSRQGKRLNQTATGATTQDGTKTTQASIQEEKVYSDDQKDEEDEDIEVTTHHDINLDVIHSHTGVQTIRR